MSVRGGGLKQIDLAAYIDSDDCKHVLREYSVDGQTVIREIDLPADVTEPQHAVQLVHVNTTLAFYAVCRVCGKRIKTVECPSVRLSVLSIDSSSSVRLVCC